MGPIRCYQSGPGSNGNEGVLYIPQSSSITGNSPSDCLVSYPGHLLGVSSPYAEEQSVYSTAPADWAKGQMRNKMNEVPVTFKVSSNNLKIVTAEMVYM